MFCKILLLLKTALIEFSPVAVQKSALKCFQLDFSIPGTALHRFVHIEGENASVRHN
jgi:hypothetical protein